MRGGAHRQLVPTISTSTPVLHGDRRARRALSGGRSSARLGARDHQERIGFSTTFFSSVDGETEEEILRELRQFMRARTTLLISHRVSTVRDADKIIYLRGGEIIEQGSHDELLARRGAYYELYRRQSLARQVESMERVERSL